MPGCTRRSTGLAALWLLLLAACASFDPATATYDQFPMARGDRAVRAIAILPGGELADAIGAELGKRGFVVYPASWTASTVTGVDFRAVAESYIPKRENPRLVESVKSQLRPHNVDAFLVVVKPEDFIPRQVRDHPNWQEASIHIYSTHYETADSHSTLIWVNAEKGPAKTAGEAAATIVGRLARRSGP